MSRTERRAYLYARAMNNGGVVDWQTGAVRYPGPGD